MSKETTPKQQPNGLTVTALVLGIAAYIFVAPGLALVGIPLAGWGMSKGGSKGLGWSAVVVSSVALLIYMGRTFG